MESMLHLFSVGYSIEDPVPLPRKNPTGDSSYGSRTQMQSSGMEATPWETPRSVGSPRQSPINIQGTGISIDRSPPRQTRGTAALLPGNKPSPHQHSEQLMDPS